MQTLATHPLTATATASLVKRLPYKWAFADTPVAENGDIPSIATDGTTVFVNPAYLAELTPEEAMYMVAFITTMKFNLFLERRGDRDPQLWTDACNVSINGQLADLGITGMPEGGLREPALDGRIADEIYDLLITRDPVIGEKLLELVEWHLSSDGGEELEEMASTIERTDTVQNAVDAGVRGETAHREATAALMRGMIIEHGAESTHATEPTS